MNWWSDLQLVRKGVVDITFTVAAWNDKRDGEEQTASRGE